MGNLINIVILTLLSFLTLRDVIAWSGLIKPEWKYSWLFYGRYDKQVLRRTLYELGFDKSECNLLKKEIQSTVRSCMFNTKNTNNSSEKLIALLSKYLIKFNEMIQYGDKTPTESNFYISTMEASHNQEDLNVMCDLIHELILIDCKHGKIPKIPDFILVPKGGNPLLGYAYANKQKSIEIFKKSSNDKSNAKISKGEFEKELITNFEGSWEILKKSKDFNDKKLFGVVIDCNLSGGGQVIKLMNEFNGIIENLELNIEKVVNAYVLFRVDNDGEDIDKKYNDNNYYINRYFDLTEEMKSFLHNLKGKKKVLNPYNNDDQKKIEEYIKALKDKKLYKVNVDCCEECEKKDKAS